MVLQGTSEPESREWYCVHRPLINAAEGIAFAGTSNTSYRLMLHRLIDMRATTARLRASSTFMFLERARSRARVC